MPIDAFASEPQYLAHLRPVFDALGDSQGTLFVSEALLESVSGAISGSVPKNDRPMLVASFSDSRYVRSRGRPVIYLEHGAGQSYLTPELHPSYAGGPEHEGTVLFLSPREDVAQKWRDAYPDVPAVAIGSPLLDSYRMIERHPGPKTVCISFHSDIRLVPETASTWSYYEPYLPAEIEKLKSRGWTVLGHAHPRLFRHIAHKLERAGAQPVEHFADVIKTAGVYACDNSSTLYEAAALDIPVVALNAPWYRRDVNHGLRFWDMVPGYQCDDSTELALWIQRARLNTLKMMQTRARASEYVYGPRPGHAVWLATRAIQRHVLKSDSQAVVLA